MNSLKLVITNEAYSDIDNISKFISKNDSVSAKKFLKRIQIACSLLTKFPNIGVHKAGLKDKEVKLFILNKQYLIAYKVDNENLVILKVSSRYQDIISKM